MRSPALALTWNVWWRYRWGLAACAAVWLVLAALGLLLPRVASGPEDHITPVGVMVLGLFVPAFVFTAYAFSWITSDVQLEARETGFPTRTFTLPMSTAALVALPMLQGAAVTALAWVAWAAAVLRPAGIDAPLVWPALQAAALLAWLQAIVWWSFPLRYLRVIAAAPVLTAIGLAPALGVAFETPPAVVALALAALLPAAYGVALLGVAHTRRGDAPTWTWPALLGAAVASRRSRRAAPFSSALQAQSWLEWRLRGAGFPFMVGLVAVVWTLIVVTGKGEEAINTIASVDEMGFYGRAVAVLTAPGLLLAFLAALVPFLAGITGVELSSMRTVGHKPPGATFGCHPFMALRPLTDAELIAAKLRMAVRSTLTGWALVLVVAVLSLGLTGKWRQLAGAPLIQPYSGPEVWGGLAAGLGGIVLLTWLGLVGNLWIGLTGRPWLIRLVCVSAAVIWVPLGLIGFSLAHQPEILEALAAALPYIAAAAVALKLLLAGWLAHVLWRRGLVGPRALLTVAVVWAVVAASAVALLARLAPPAAVVLAVMVMLPLNRFAAAPLALAWNRHR